MRSAFCILLAGVMALQAAPLAFGEEVSHFDEPSSDVMGSEITSPEWDKRIFNSDNSVLATLLGQSAANLTEESLSQSFGDLLVTNPNALFLDLNGDGVTGDMWDGLLFSLFWGGHYYGTYSTSTYQYGLQSRFRSVEVVRSADVIRSKLTDANVLLVSPLNDGRRSATINDLAQLMLEGNRKADGHQDGSVALATLSLLALVNPLATTDQGPFLQASPIQTRSLAEKIRVDLHSEMIGANFHSGGNNLALDSSVNRLATIVAMVEMYLHVNKTEIVSEGTEIALRGALYFMAFEIKRLNIKRDQRDRIFKSLIQTLAKNAPRTLEVAAYKATTKEALENLKDVVRKIPYLSLHTSSNDRKSRIAISLVAYGVTMALWMKGVVPEIVGSGRSSSFGPVAMAWVSAAVVPSGVSLLTHWLLRPRRVGLLDPGVKAFYEDMVCEKEMIKE